MNNVSIISGRSNEPLAKLIADHLGIELTPVNLEPFSGGENRVEILDSVRKRTVFIIQSAYTYEPNSPSPNDYIMETVMMADACFRASAKEIVLVLPCLPYTEETDLINPIDPDSIVCQTDFQRHMKEVIFPLHKDTNSPDDPELIQNLKYHYEAHENLSTQNITITPFAHPNPFKLIAKLLQFSACGVNQLLTLSLPRPQLVGYFDIPLDDLPIAPVLKQLSFITNIATSDISLAKQASQIANSLNLPFTLLHNLPNDKDFNIMGSSITTSSHVLFIDEMHDRVFRAAKQLVSPHNCKVSLFIIHLLLPDPELNIHQLQSDTCFTSIYTTNSIRIPSSLSSKLCVIDVSSYLAESLKCVHLGQSLKDLVKKMQA